MCECGSPSAIHSTLFLYVETLICVTLPSDIRSLTLQPALAFDISGRAHATISLVDLDASGTELGRSSIGGLL